MIRNILFGLGLVGVTAFLALPANAATTSTIQVKNDTDLVGYSATLRGTIECENCGVLYYTPSSYTFVDGSPASEFGEMFDGPSSSGQQAEIDWFNEVTGENYDDTYFVKDESVDDNTSYSTTALYVILKFGQKPEYTVLANLTGGIMTFLWDPESGDGNGLSHISFLSDEPFEIVPLPAAGWMMIAGLAGLGAIGWRRRSSPVVRG